MVQCRVLNITFFLRLNSDQRKPWNFSISKMFGYRVDVHTTSVTSYIPPSGLNFAVCTGQYWSYVPPPPPLSWGLWVLAWRYCVYDSSATLNSDWHLKHACRYPARNWTPHPPIWQKWRGTQSPCCPVNVYSFTVLFIPAEARFYFIPGAMGIKWIAQRHNSN